MSWYSSSGVGDRGKQDDPWSSIVDLMSAFALVLFLAVMFFILDYSRADKQLKQKEQKVIAQQRMLTKKTRQLEQSIAALKTKTTILKKSEKDRDRFKDEAQRLAFQMELLRKKEALLLEEKRKLDALLLQQRRNKEELDKKIVEQRALVRAQKEETLRQQTFLAKSKMNEARCQQQLKRLLEEKKNVLSAIYRVFSMRQQKKSAVGFDPRTGKFRLGGNILFSEGRAILREEGKRQLKQVLLTLDKVLLKPNVRPMIAGIMVEGHTNARGRLARNWQLSSLRAISAVQYMLSLVRHDKRRYRIYSRLLFGAAFGPFRPIITRQKQIDQRRSRRIEIKVLFHDQKKLQSILGASGRQKR